MLHRLFPSRIKLDGCIAHIVLDKFASRIPPWPQWLRGPHDRPSEHKTGRPAKLSGSADPMTGLRNIKLDGLRNSSRFAHSAGLLARCLALPLAFGAGFGLALSWLLRQGSRNCRIASLTQIRIAAIKTLWNTWNESRPCWPSALRSLDKALSFAAWLLRSTIALAICFFGIQMFCLLRHCFVLRHRLRFAFGFRLCRFRLESAPTISPPPSTARNSRWRPW